MSFPSSISAEFQSTPPARGATAVVEERLLQSLISIHAPREGGDADVELQLLRIEVISIHAPREGGDASIHISMCSSGSFQSTPPARGATVQLTSPLAPSIFQSTPPARGAT